MLNITDFLPTSDWPDIVSRRAVDKIGEYMNDEVKTASVITGAAYIVHNAPYNGKILAFILTWKDTLSDDEEKHDVEYALNGNFINLISICETLLTRDIALALAQYNIVIGSPPPIGPVPPFLILPGTWATSIASIIGDIDLTFSVAVETMIKTSFLSLGL
jgi:hypothetical protein